MRRMQKKKFTIFLISILFLSLIGTTYGCQPKQIYETETFRYQVFESDGEEWVSIEGLTEKGRQQKNIVIPEEIDGKRVAIYQGYDEAPNAKKIIVPYNILTINSWGLSRARLIITSYSSDIKVLYVNCYYHNSTLMEPDFYIASAALENFQTNIVNSDVYSIANIQYLFNYGDSQNKGVSFIDDLDIGEELEIIPTTPKRDGYVFTGWYEEPECRNKIELNGYVKADEEIIYLYAGWKENE